MFRYSALILQRVCKVMTKSAISHIFLIYTVIDIDFMSFVKRVEIYLTVGKAFRNEKSNAQVCSDKSTFF